LHKAAVACDRGGEMCSRHYAFEGRCYVLAVGLMMPSRDLPKELLSELDAGNLSGQWMERGGSAVIAPNASYVVEPLYDREKLIVVDINLSDIDAEFMTLDLSGHYARPDIFNFEAKGR